jgi:TolB-like protein/Flp pilus assembly protein TadD
LYPDYLDARDNLADDYLSMSMYPEAVATIERGMSLAGRTPELVTRLARAYALSGRGDEADTLLQELHERATSEYVLPRYFAEVYASLGNTDEALKWLKKSREERDWGVLLLKTWPAWDSLRSDPRFGDLVERMNFPEAPVSEPVKPGEAATAPIEKIAVLPFTSISSEAGEEWFVDGMTVTLTAQLGRIKALTVISSRSAMELKGTSKPVREIAQELGVDGLIEGTVIRVGNNVQITAELIDGRRDEQIWAGNFQGTFDDILALQSEVTLAIAQKIDAALTPEEERQIGSTEAVNPEAYEAYLKGIFFMDKQTEKSFEIAADYFEQAIEIEPDYAEAYARLSLAYWAPSIWGYTPPGESLRKAKTYANKAIRLDETCAVAHDAMGVIALNDDWDWQRAKQSFERAIELNPNYSYGYSSLAWYFVAAGRFDEAIEMMQTAVNLDPLSPALNNGLANVHMYSGQVEPAVEQRKETLKLDPSHLDTLSDLARDYLIMSRYADAEKSIEEALNHHGRTAGLVASLARTYALWGRKSEAEKLLQELQDRDRDEYILPSDFARVHAALGNKDEAFRWLEKAQQERESYMISLRVSPWWDSLRSDPRFDDLVQRMKYPD